MAEEIDELFGSEESSSEGEELPSTQHHMKELFGNNEDDSDNDQQTAQNQITTSNKSDDDQELDFSNDEVRAGSPSEDSETQQQQQHDERSAGEFEEEKMDQDTPMGSDTEEQQETMGSNNEPQQEIISDDEPQQEIISDDEQQQNMSSDDEQQQQNKGSDNEEEGQKEKNVSDEGRQEDSDAEKPQMSVSDDDGEQVIENSDNEGHNVNQESKKDAGDGFEEMSNDTKDGSSDNEKGQAAPTTQDLFGDALDVSSSDDDDEQSTVKKEEQIEEPVKKQEDVPRIPESFLDEDDRPPSPVEEEGLSIAIELPRCNMSLGKELHFIKLPNFLSVDTKPFDSNYYEDEIDEDEVMDEEGRARLKLKVENTIRWRYGRDAEGNEVKESNCRMVRWSDGSISMHLGNEIFDVFKMPVAGEQNHLFVQQGTGLQAQAVFKNKLTFRPHSTASQTHKKMTRSIADRMQRAQKIKMMPATELDPESQREKLMKKEDELLRSANRRESAQRRARERSSSSKGLNNDYLEEDGEEEEGFEESIASIKNKYKKSLAERERIYSSDDSEEDTSKLQAAKLDIDSDDEDEEIKAKKEELKKKKQQASRKIIESDEDSDANE